MHSLPNTHAAPTPNLAIADLVLNEPNLDIRAGTVRIEALLDYEGLALLEGQLTALKMLMKRKRAPETVGSGTRPKIAASQSPDGDDHS